MIIDVKMFLCFFPNYQIVQIYFRKKFKYRYEKYHSERNMEYFGTQPIFLNSPFMSIDIMILILITVSS